MIDIFRISHTYFIGFSHVLSICSSPISEEREIEHIGTVIEHMGTQFEDKQHWLNNTNNAKIVKCTLCVGSKLMKAAFFTESELIICTIFNGQ